MDKAELMKRLSGMSSEFVADLIRQALEDSDIPYIEDAGRVVFDGLDIANTVSFNYEFSISNDTLKQKSSYNNVRLNCDRVWIESTDIYAADWEENSQTAAA